MQLLSPVVQSPNLIELIDGLEFVLQVLSKTSLHIVVGRTCRRGLIVNLKTDHVRVVFVVFSNLTNDALAVEAIRRVQQICILAEPERDGLPSETWDKDFRVFFLHP